MIDLSKLIIDKANQKGLSVRALALESDISYTTLRDNIKNNDMKVSQLEKIVKALGLEMNSFFQEEDESSENKLLKKYVSSLEKEKELVIALKELEAELKKCQEEKIEMEKIQEEKNFEPGTIEHTLAVYRKSAKISDQRINTLEKENEEFREELIELRKKIRKYEGR